MSNRQSVAEQFPEMLRKFVEELANTVKPTRVLITLKNLNAKIDAARKLGATNAETFTLNELKELENFIRARREFPNSIEAKEVQTYLVVQLVKKGVESCIFVSVQAMEGGKNE